MATREENLKKINDELEALSDEELEHIAGGNVGATEYDSRFLKEMGFMNEIVNIGWFGQGWTDGSRAVDKGWAKAGIGCHTKYAEANKYWIIATGQPLSRQEAYEYVANKVGKSFNYDDYSFSMPRQMITMATREENLKKLNAELEKLSDEQLEKVAGGIRFYCMPANQQAESNAKLQGGLEQPKKYSSVLKLVK